MVHVGNVLHIYIPALLKMATHCHKTLASSTCQYEMFEVNANVGEHAAVFLQTWSFTWAPDVSCICTMFLKGQGKRAL